MSPTTLAAGTKCNQPLCTGNGQREKRVEEGVQPVLQYGGEVKTLKPGDLLCSVGPHPGVGLLLFCRVCSCFAKPLCPRLVFVASLFVFLEMCGLTGCGHC